ncbi:MAG: hypothetical protein CVU69_08645 [Deltaproteobacteria bacterium HGW-Deltaproteobacteria-4]|nr:MAG: hypothetical protein CVU69_08645 [Deltaproteobacteria bacterium HGW-Deltaproteobacteria-4]
MLWWATLWSAVFQLEYGLLVCMIAAMNSIIPLIFRLALVSLLSLLLPVVALAVNFAAGAKAPAGHQFKLYPYFYSADTKTDKDGNPAIRELGLKKYGVQIFNSYQTGDLNLSAIIPISRVEVAKFDAVDSGIGDIQLRLGYYLPVEWATFLPVLMVKIPFGNYDKNALVNVSDGQSDLVAELYFFKLVQPLSFDAVIKYAKRFRNHDNDFTPGNEFSAEGLLTWRLAEKIRFGPAINFVVGGENRREGKSVADSGLMRLAAGGELYYARIDRMIISLAAYQDLLTRNSNSGILVMSRFAIDF